jgi:hypothetical protein
MKERSMRKTKGAVRIFGVVAAALLVLAGAFTACDSGGDDSADTLPVTTAEQAADAAEAFGAVNTAWVTVMLAEEGAGTLPAGITVDDSTTLGRREFTGTKGINFSSYADPVSGYVITGRIVATANAGSYVFSGALALSGGPGKITSLSFDAFTVTVSGGTVSFSGSATANGTALNVATFGTAISGGSAGDTVPVGTWISRDSNQTFKFVVYPGNVSAVYGKSGGVYALFAVSAGGYYDAARFLFISEDPEAYTGFLRRSGGFDSTGNTMAQSLISQNGPIIYAMTGGDPATGLGAWTAVIDQGAGENLRWYRSITLTLAAGAGASSVTGEQQFVTDSANPEPLENISPITFTFGAWVASADGTGTFEAGDSNYPDYWPDGTYNFVRVGDVVVIGTQSDNSSATADQIKTAVFDRQ